MPLKSLNTLWRTLKIPLINCEDNLILTWSENCFIFSATGGKKICNNGFVTFSTQDDIKLLKQ